MVKALCRELTLRKDYLGTQHLETLYFGGGTPSLLSEEELTVLMTAIRGIYTWTENTECTIECNPDDLTAETLERLLRNGFNRLSIGLQSFNDDELRWMNRAHTAAESVECVKRAQEAGFSNISIDLIYGSKFQNLQQWRETLQMAVDLNVQHISAYNLTIETKTALGVKHNRGEEPLIDENLSSRQFEEMIRFLGANGFEQYEISNFAKSGYIAQHNSRYWLGYTYLGIGPSAHSYNGQTRQWNVSSNATYIREVTANGAFYETETLSLDNRYNEYVLTRLRTIWGCDVEEIQRLFGEIYKKRFLAEAQKMTKYTEWRHNTLLLNGNGKLIADKLAMALFV